MDPSTYLDLLEQANRILNAGSFGDVARRVSEFVKDLPEPSFPTDATKDACNGDQGER